MEYTFSEKYKNNVILEKTFKFSIGIVLYAEQLEEKRKYVLSRQILKAGTSIGANAKEAQNAESTADFIHKMKIALKEADETEYWLFLCEAISHYPDCKHLLEELKGILKILNKIISSSKRR
ncbi:four helix bundle protein [Dokdonia sinensis]|uniref:Four helix bundle protein n=1 Tax=Dokdonia sinensis TaxID=2479847 RepID=A0A3M0GLB9_9FLAO|nr:four helix bundle protein [Dokdonia sinensis]RMB63472.1 four helix bundle protein [Dokdonia sinensis]